MKAPRQSDVARLAGVSQSAVSRVISGDVDRIPAETRDRIRAAVKDLGYVPNAAARNLRNKRNRLLGVHTFEAVFPHARDDFYFEFLLGIEERAEELGYDLVLFTSTGARDGRRRIYRDGTNRLNLADGAVLLGAATDREELARLWRDGYLFVHIGRREVPGAEIPCIVPDYVSAAGRIVASLAERGLSVPADVSVAVLEGSGDEPGHRWDCLMVPRKEIGRIAIDALVARVENPEAEPVGRLVACDLVAGETVADARTRE